mmetsp:Transcript_17569/g.15484  ORF Transcript_17569/g.15484 Transcript_17569/m.15484 type:complete len:158 (-) Transcript_17569:190-663(-)
MVKRSIHNFKMIDSSALMQDITRTARKRMLKEPKEIQKQIKKSYSRMKTKKLVQELKSRTQKLQRMFTQEFKDDKPKFIQTVVNSPKVGFSKIMIENGINKNIKIIPKKSIITRFDGRAKVKDNFYNKEQKLSRFLSSTHNFDIKVELKWKNYIENK